MGTKITAEEKAAIASFKGPVTKCPEGYARGALNQTVWNLLHSQYETWLSREREMPTPEQQIAVLDARYNVMGVITARQGAGRQTDENRNAEIVNLHRLKVTPRNIAERYGLSRAQVYVILSKAA